VSRLILVLAILGFAHPVLAQPDDWSYNRRESREAAREARREAREATREAREAARQARRDEWELRGDGRDGVHLRILRSYHLPSGSVASEPVVVIGGSASIDGRAEDDVVVIGGTLRVGPNAVIRGDAVSVGGKIIIDPAAQVDGRVDETVVVWPDINFGWGSVPNGWWAVASFGAMLLRLGIVLMVSLLVTWFAPDWTYRIGARISDAAGSSLFLGIAAQVLFVPALILVSIVLVISLVGIPVLFVGLPVFLAAAALFWTAGFAGVVGRLGARLRGQHPGSSSSPTLDLLTGFTAVSALTVIAHFIAVGPWWTTPMFYGFRAAGLVVEWIVWTLGLGAALTSFASRRSDAPPAIPIIPSPAPSRT
jgi:hypothetical protein